MEIEIAGMVNTGKTKIEILVYYKEKYGERVLAVPVAEGFNYFAWIAPIFIGVLAVSYKNLTLPTILHV